MEPQEVAEFRAKCIAAIGRCDDPDILEAMVCIKRLYEASQAENERLKAEKDEIEQLALTHIGAKGLLMSENERLTRVVEQAIDLAKIELVKRRSIGTSHYYEEGLDTDFPDLFAQLKGADCG